jgi:DNA-binding NtrC family response regulator
MSGYTDDVGILTGLGEDTTAFLQKPFTPASLAQTVRKLLDASAETQQPDFRRDAAKPAAN